MAKRKTSLRDDIKRVYRGLESTVTGMGSLYRHITDPWKSKADKVIDSGAVFLGSNAALAGALYSANNFLMKPGLENILGSERMENLGNFFNSHSTAELVLNGLYHGAVYGVANWKLIWPLTKKVFKRNTSPSWSNHMKSWLILASAYAMFNFSEANHDSRRYIDKLGKIGVVKGLIDKENLAIVDKHLSGEGVAIASNRVLYYSSIVADFFNISARDKTKSRPARSDDLALAMDLAAKKYGLDRALVEAVVWQESEFDIRAVSKCGAAGSMQLMPGTAADEGLNIYTRYKRDKVIIRCSQGRSYAMALRTRINGQSDSEIQKIDERFNPYKNVDAGSRYLKEQVARFGNVSLGLAAYNAGPDRVEEYNGIPPFRQTRNYVKGIKKKMNILKKVYGVR